MLIVVQLLLAMLPSLRAETMPEPGTVTSGLMRPSSVGPQLENEAIELALVPRSVAPTEAGERLLHTVGPRFEEIEAELAAIRELREKPAGTIRITAGDHPVHSILWRSAGSDQPYVHLLTVLQAA